MDKQLDACFDRVEKALGTLIDSIAKYNPSTNQANELGKADAELTRGLQDLQTHQANYQRIQDLRAATASHDAQIKETVRLLAATRRELVGASATVFPGGPSYDINYDELLSYARRISKTTIPPAGAINGIQQQQLQLQLQQNADPNSRGENGGVETAATTPAGAGTPNGLQSHSASATPAAHVNGQQANGIITSGGAGVGGAAQAAGLLPEQLTAHLNPHSGVEFAPWPSEDQVRKGAVAALAHLAERGVDAEGHDPRRAEEEAAERERERVEQEQRQQQERERAEQERRRRRQEEDEAAAERWRRASVLGGGAEAAGAGGMGAGAGGGAGASPTQPGRPAAAAQFQFMGDDDDDDDDD
ncbi:vitamin-D-receptor interacting mediator subunit 4-domain-containing protein [Xylariaceae sp. FL0804]|nr:vitamin-D-receptor interacting mediator subunit 4-domain-containing protein [Xylariaceae sp. FL0804]